MKTLLIFGLMLVAWGSASVPAQARPEFLTVMESNYVPYSSSLAARSCNNCHVSSADLARNAYGKQVEAAMKISGSPKLTPALLTGVENQHMDSDAATFLDKIKAGVAPAVLTANHVLVSVPGQTASSPQAGPVKSEAKPKKSPIPSNGFHPAIVHFPIALFIAGLVLDFLGMLRKDKTLLHAGWYNLVFAALTAFAGIATGFLALLLLKAPLTGLIRQHMVLAVIATALMWLMVYLRRHRHERMTRTSLALYYALALAGFLLISYAGHLGGQFVYGE